MRELAKRAVACKGWRWKEGMLPLALDDEGDWIPCERVWRNHKDKLDRPPCGSLPDLSDPVTLAWLRYLVRVAYANTIVITFGKGWWSVETDNHRWDQDNSASFQEALVAALEAGE